MAFTGIFDARELSATNYLGLSRAKVYELITEGALPAVKIGGCRRLRAVDLRAFVDSLDAAS